MKYDYYAVTSGSEDKLRIEMLVKPNVWSYVDNNHREQPHPELVSIRLVMDGKIIYQADKAASKMLIKELRDVFKKSGICKEPVIIEC